MDRYILPDRYTCPEPRGEHSRWWPLRYVRSSFHLTHHIIFTKLYSLHIHRCWIRYDRHLRQAPVTPIFFRHHAQIDRIWALWQKKDPATRQYAITGTGTLFNHPPLPGREDNRSDRSGKTVASPIKDFMDTKGGSFCYEYV